MAFRADAAFAKPEVYKALEEPRKPLPNLGRLDNFTCFFSIVGYSLLVSGPDLALSLLC